ncbi:hypothetical protein CC78DRAFT_577555 [Lojkania enalia]|uniref:Uncharacterized protein n=1 Tax=Lojkania enalia TaxID=147567 RepID=A0A9P4KE55_9PLEO|nr:hypothetical protein CC78DRAFT_577555 [Didymosphaeria enalia]
MNSADFPLRSVITCYHALVSGVVQLGETPDTLLAAGRSSMACSRPIFICGCAGLHLRQARGDHRQHLQSSTAHLPSRHPLQQSMRQMPICATFVTLTGQPSRRARERLKTATAFPSCLRNALLLVWLPPPKAISCDHDTAKIPACTCTELVSNSPEVTFTVAGRAGCHDIGCAREPANREDGGF